MDPVLVNTGLVVARRARTLIQVHTIGHLSFRLLALIMDHQVPLLLFPVGEETGLNIHPIRVQCESPSHNSFSFFPTNISET